MHERAGRHVEGLLQMPSNNHSVFRFFLFFSKFYLKRSKYMFGVYDETNSLYNPLDGTKQKRKKASKVEMIFSPSTRHPPL